MLFLAAHQLAESKPSRLFTHTRRYVRSIDPKLSINDRAVEIHQFSGYLQLWVGG